MLRALTAYVEVVGSAPMWQQVASGTPLISPSGGSRGGSLRRCVFRCEGATYRNVRDAIASHRTDDGGNGEVTLVVERPVNASTPLAPRDDGGARLQPLSDVILRDLASGADAEKAAEPQDEGSAASRARRFFGVDDDG